ncbi:MAG: ribosome maturation factor RimP [Aquificae bacterium]|nr:ribosome maturation factor RimP [Aquificota bacterium]
MDIVERVKELLQPLLEERGLKLVDVEYIKEGKPVLRIYIYNNEGTSIDDCEWISRRIGALLDIEDLIPHSYTLEVSSPGLNRKLKNPEEYEIFKGREIKIVTKEPIDKKQVFKGTLKGLEEENVKIEEKGCEVKIPLENISRANLEF